MITKLAFEDLVELIVDETDPTIVLDLVTKTANGLTTFDILLAATEEVMGWLTMQKIHDIIRQRLEEKCNHIFYQQYNNLINGMGSF